MTHIGQQYKKLIRESEEPEDYGTGTVNGDDIFDRKTYVPFYDRLFTKPDYMKEKENMVGEVVMMSPQEYFEECAEKIFGGRTSVEQLKRSREINKQNIQNIKDLITKYKRRLFLPYLNYAEKQQEGLHRMYVAGELFGWNHKFPVLVINWYDEDRHQNDVERRRKKEILDHIYFKVNNALRYVYSDLEEFENQLGVEFGKYSDDPEIYQIKYDGDVVKVSLEEYPQYVYEFPLSDIKIEEKELDDDILLDDDPVDLSEEELKEIDGMTPYQVLKWLEKNK